MSMRTALSITASALTLGTTNEPSKEDRRRSREFWGDSILAEIIGATNLKHPKESLNASFTKSQCNTELLPNPFVNCVFHHGANGKTQVLRRTKCVHRNRNPVWCVNQHCLFIIHTDALTNDKNKNDDGNDNKFSSPQLTLEVRHQGSPKCHLIGSATMDLDDIYNQCDERRIELDLDHPLTTHQHDHNGNTDAINQPQKLTIRFRRATTLDLTFMTKLAMMVKRPNDSSPFRDDPTTTISTVAKNSIKSIHHNSTEEQRTQPFITEIKQATVISNNLKKLLCFRRRKIKDQDGTIRYRVEPYPDSNRPPEQTMYLSDEELVDEMYKPSTNWLVTPVSQSPSSLSTHREEFGVGGGRSNLGRIHLEILKCDFLPNLDFDLNGIWGNMTDPFVSVVFEDKIFQTDVIDDALSPVWMPWTQRAFTFNITDGCSPLYLAVMDYDVGPMDHDFVGRAVVNLNRLMGGEGGVEYILEYGLYQSDNLSDRAQVRDYNLCLYASS